MTVKPPIIFKPQSLIKKGLNLHFVFDIQQLPQSILKELEQQNSDLNDFTQLILVAHAGKPLWETLAVNGMTQLQKQSSDPIDDFTVSSINGWFKQHHPTLNKKIIYPSTLPTPLQALGQLAHWHHPSPFLVGINNLYGTWFAYRAAVLCNSDFITSEPIKSQSPCTSCSSKACITQCPAQAVSEVAFNMDACLQYRLKENSLCQHTCLARVACPVGKSQQYTDEQIRYHYGVSLKMIHSVK